MRISLLLVCLIGLALRGHADDSALQVAGGNLRMMDEHSSVRMTGEEVEITVSSENYRVHAKFQFFNVGPSTSVLVGFPQFCRGDVQQVGEFKDFSTLVDGHVVNTENRLLDDSRELEDGPGEAPLVRRKWKTKDVFFPANRQVETEVIYTAPYGKVFTGGRFVSYLVGTGHSWNGPIGRSTFTVVFPDEALLNYRTPGHFWGDGLPVEPVRRERNRLIWTVAEFEPSPHASFEFSLTRPDDDISTSLQAELIPLKPSVLQYLSLWQLRLLRNGIYAQYGKSFKSPDLRRYFESQGWYHPRAEFTEKNLSPVAKDNVKAVATYERSLGK